MTTTLTQPRSLILKIETAFIFLLGLAIFVSKPLIYLSISLLVMVTLVRVATDQDYRYELFDNKLFWASTGVFVLGLLSAVIGPGSAEDVGWMARKTMLLPLVVPLVMAFSQKINRTAGLTGAVMGFWIAFVMTGNLQNWSWTGGRIEGATWLIDTWAVICAMFIMLLVPVVLMETPNKTWRGILIATILGALVMLLTNGGRGPLLGVVAGVFIYLAVKNRMALLVVGVLGTSSVFVAHSIWPEQVDALQNRVESITKVDTEESIYLRLALWETGLALLTKQIETGDKGFWFGYRKKGKGDLPNDFYYNEFIDRAKFKPTVLKEYDWKLTDFHNSYLESVFRNGILWTLGALFVLTWLAIGPLQLGKGFSTTWVAVPSLIGFLITAISYTLLPHFAFLFLIFFMALGRGFER